MSFAEYSKTLPKAREIANALYGDPKTHQEWVDKLNKIGDINKILVV